MATTFDSIPWDDLIAVGIRTTSDGPFADDVFWQFLSRQGDRDALLELPSTPATEPVFDGLKRHLHGIDWARVALAMCCAEDRMFCVWRRGTEARSTLDLATRFDALIGRLGGRRGSIGPVFEQLHAAWSGTDRRYHDLRHLAACLDELDATPTDPAITGRVELALWYHDAVYQPAAHDCEERSAQLLLRDADALGLSTDTARTAADLVRATAHLSGRPGDSHNDPAVDLIADIDLSILGRDPLSFMDFDYSVEEEYAAVPTKLFRSRRGAFLASLLSTPRIFRTAELHARYERTARMQITALLRSPRYSSFR